MDLRQIRYFLAVVEAGTFSAAAVDLHMTQPPLSTSINQLEKSLGVRLLDRTPRGVVPTPAGEYLVRTGTDLLQRVAGMERRLKGMGRGTQGQVSIAAVPAYSWAHMAGLLTEFTSRAPDVDITLIEMPSRQIIEQVLQQQIDVGVVATSDAARLRDSYETRLHVAAVEPLPLVAVLPPRYQDAPDPIDLATLLNEVWIVPQTTPGLPGATRILEAVWEELGPPRDVRVVSTMQSAAPLVAAGLGVGLIPGTFGAVAPTSVVTRRILQPIPGLEAVMLWSATVEATPATKILLDVAGIGASTT
ncbi:LysR family transcriptional regulator [Georgenia thermotolerans]|uniref:LysR family transcriptional regulator n=1 Tax=Georgenia thermotolerans TaxID=527326 RepID=A0A7J5UTK2_9MICO|nr:LysR family transcriptional regulator [Georgenia thermotolerans]KAE8765615.1 LysR family transcriptional regulator [Georgenia thermotolerans]